MIKSNDVAIGFFWHPHDKTSFPPGVHLWSEGISPSLSLLFFPGKAPFTMNTQNDQNLSNNKINACTRGDKAIRDKSHL